MSAGLVNAAAIESFAEAAAVLSRNGTLSAQEKGLLIVSAYRQGLTRLHAAGVLTPQVEAEFLALADVALTQLRELHKELGRSLVQLLQLYSLEPIPPHPAREYHDHAPLTTGEKVADWWHRKAVPWLRDDTL